MATQSQHYIKAGEGERTLPFFPHRKNTKIQRIFLFTPSPLSALPKCDMNQVQAHSLSKSSISCQRNFDNAPSILGTFLNILQIISKISFPKIELGILSAKLFCKNSGLLDKALIQFALSNSQYYLVQIESALHQVNPNFYEIILR